MTTFCHHTLKTCLLNASGCYSTTKEQIDDLYQSEACSAIVSKSATLNWQQGNDHPRLYIDDQYCINNVGLSNFGLSYYNQFVYKNENKLYIQSIYPQSVDNLKLLLLNTSSDTIEVNLSCPNVTTIDIHDYEIYFKAIHEYACDKTVGIKLPPLYHQYDFDTISEWLLKYEIDFITCCNTIPNCLLIDSQHESTRIYPNNGLGGMSFKPLSLANVYQFYIRLGSNVDIIGCGGVYHGQDVFDYILCGATCVQIGSHLIKQGVSCFEQINHELMQLMKNKNYSHINEFRGQLKLCSKL
ncbi:MAG TPA: hypothetical protein VLG50_05450 [Candidatus Saccharimonadales bacterium]|nr:hypothetical protein [Candidatus Saccharimonadales bacterium]